MIEEKVDFIYPTDEMVDSLKDYCMVKYNCTLSDSELEWLAGFIADYCEWSQNHCRPIPLTSRFIQLMSVINESMSHGVDAEQTWEEIAYALGFRAYEGVTIRSLAIKAGISPMGISKRVKRFRKKANIPAIFDCGGRLKF